MKIDKIISMANQNVQLRFLAMERSLRATGCNLPLWVIPYDDNLFDLPDGSTWWNIPEISDWLGQEKARPVMRKYQCLTTENYQFVDADVCFLRNPEQILEPYSGFVTSCGHWRDVAQTVTPESADLFASKTTLWHKNVFNTGQFACDQKIYSIEELKKVSMSPNFVNTCLRFKFHEQPGLNLLVLETGIKVTNLTLPPISMESTWAGDYPGEYDHYWSIREHKPYLIHWAGTPLDIPRPINQIFYNFLTPSEKLEWDEQLKSWSLKNKHKKRSFRVIASKVKAAFKELTKF
jgi:hypothetical protein